METAITIIIIISFFMGIITIILLPILLCHGTLCLALHKCLIHFVKLSNWGKVVFTAPLTLTSDSCFKEHSRTCWLLFLCAGKARTMWTCWKQGNGMWGPEGLSPLPQQRSTGRAYLLTGASWSVFGGLAGVLLSKSSKSCHALLSELPLGTSQDIQSAHNNGLLPSLASSLLPPTKVVAIFPPLVNYWLIFIGFQDWSYFTSNF